MKRRTPRVAQIGEVYTFRCGDRYGACQVISLKKEAKRRQAELATIDWLATRPPTKEDALAILRQTWGHWNGRPARCWVDAEVPWWMELAFEGDVLERFDEACGAWGHWHTARGVFHREEWARRKNQKIGADPTMVTIDIGGGAREIRRDAQRIVIGDDTPWSFRVPEKGSARFAALDVLERLDDVSYRGDDPAFGDWAVERGIEAIEWAGHGQRAIDLSRSRGLARLAIDVGDDDLALRIPDTVAFLTLRRRPEGATVSGADVRFPFHLRLSAKRMGAPRGLDGCDVVVFTGIVASDTDALKAFPDVSELALQGAPGSLSDVSGFASLRALKELELLELYGLDVARLPTAWPTLHQVRIHGVERSEADLLKRTFAEVPVVRVSGVHTKDWIAANVDNPFREWGEDDAAFGEKACEAWKKAKVALTKLGVAATKEGVEGVLEALVATLNKLDAKHGSIDTIRREEAAEAFFALAREGGVDTATAEQWFDAWRDF